MEKSKNLFLTRNTSTSNVDEKSPFSLYSINDKLRKTEPMTFSNYYTDLREILPENYEYK